MSDRDHFSLPVVLINIIDGYIDTYNTTDKMKLLIKEYETQYSREGDCIVHKQSKLIYNSRALSGEYFTWLSIYRPYIPYGSINYSFYSIAHLPGNYKHQRLYP